MRVALPIKEDNGLESEVLGSFKGAPLFVILSKRGDEVSVELYQNLASSDSDLAQVLLSYGVKRVVYPEARDLTKAALSSLGIEVVDRRFRTLKEAIYSLF